MILLNFHSGHAGFGGSQRNAERPGDCIDIRELGTGLLSLLLRRQDQANNFRSAWQRSSLSTGSWSTAFSVALLTSESVLAHYCVTVLFLPVSFPRNLLLHPFALMSPPSWLGHIYIGDATGISSLLGDIFKGGVSTFECFSQCHQRLRSSSFIA